MLTKRIIPCLDVDRGRVVKGVSFVDLRDAGDPAEMAAFYDREGADELVFLDITASSDERDIMVNVVKQVSEQVFIPLTVGGGLRTIADMRRMLEAGADKVSLNTAAVQNLDLVREASDFFGSQCIVVAIDARRVAASDKPIAGIDGSIALDGASVWEVYTHGGRNRTGIDAVKWAKRAAEMGAGELLVTSMDTDGRQTGYDLDLLREISEGVTIPVIASGGAGNLDHLCDALEIGKADAVLAASIFHYGKHTIREAKEHLAKKGLPVRPILEATPTQVIAMTEIQLDERGLVPAIAQNASTGEVIMLGYMNPGSIKRTFEGGDVWFYSRSRSDLWHKGEVSGNYMRIKAASVDCDGDTILLQVEPDGPICHTGNQTCFFTPLPLDRLPDGYVRQEKGPGIVEELFALIQERKRELPEGSYTAKLFQEGRERISQKVIEEAGEAAIAGATGDKEQMVRELADLFYHALVLMSATGARPEDVWKELRERRR